MLLVVALVGETCGHPVAKSPQRGDPEVVLTVRGNVEQHVIVELARTEKQRNYGLMYRTALQSGRGMLFLFERSGPLKFWMRNTYIPLDMIFMDEARRVVFVEENAEPLTLQERGPDAFSQYVLEVPGGWARAHGVEPGVAAKFLNVD
jgi:uncharacterized membrane protein (UPF0127 family)